MGGNLFKNISRHGTKRLEEKSFKITKILESFSIDYRHIPYLSEKSSHGDLDIIVSRETLTDDFIEYIVNNFQYAINGKFTNYWLLEEHQRVEVKHKLDTLSFNYDGLQTDLIVISQESIDFSQMYHAYNDLGGIIGCITKQLGYNLGREGLFNEHVPIDGYGKYKIYLTKDFSVFLDKFELDDSIYYGDKTLANVRELFEYLKSWKYFNSDWMNPHLMNATRRNRAAKRKVFNEVTDLANNQGGVLNWTSKAPLLLTFDNNIEEQIRRNTEHAQYKKDTKLSMSKERLVNVLGYEPDNINQVFMAISNDFGGPQYAREKLYTMSDKDYHKYLLDIMEKLYATENPNS